MYLENKLIVDAEPSDPLMYLKAIEDNMYIGPRINKVNASQRASSGKDISFNALECIGHGFSIFDEDKWRQYLQLSPSFGLVNIPKEDLGGQKLDGKDLVVDRGDYYIVFGLMPHQNLKNYLRISKRLLVKERVVYAPLEKIDLI